MPKGRVPSLISANNGGIEMSETKIRSACSRCKTVLAGGTRVALLKVQKAGFTKPRRLCIECASAIVERTQLDLNAIRVRLSD